jgi:Glycosyl hydrolase family 76
MKTAALTIEDRISMVEDWLLNSGVQSEEGGFYAWQDMEDNGHSYLYSEITGYAITLLSFLYVITKEDVYIKHARHAAQWIMQDALDPVGGVLTRKYVKDAVEHYSFGRGNIYSFDCGMVAFGLLKLYNITREKDYLDCAQKIINFLNTQMRKENGLYYPIFDAKTGKSVEDAGKWSTQSGSFHCKLALCLCELSSIKNDASYSAMAKRLIDSSIDSFYKNGRFITSSLNETSHLHPYSYTLEGAIYYAYKTKDESFNNICEKAFDWIAGLQQEDGGFPTQAFGSGKPDIAHERSDIQSQVLRLFYFIKSGALSGRLLERVLTMQNTAYNYKGGFFFGTDENGIFKRHSNAWCSMFALEALYLASGKVGSEMVLDYLV